MVVLVVLVLVVVLSNVIRFLKKAMVHAVVESANLLLLATPRDGVALRIVALAPDQLGQDAPSGVDEPVAHLSVAVATTNHQWVTRGRSWTSKGRRQEPGGR